MILFTFNFRSPPAKLSEQLQERQISTPTSHQPKNEIVPETITTIPETAEFQSVSTSKGSIKPAPKTSVKPKDRTENKSIVKKSEPDLSFLDDIF